MLATLNSPCLSVRMHMRRKPHRLHIEQPSAKLAGYRVHWRVSLSCDVTVSDGFADWLIGQSAQESGSVIDQSSGLAKFSALRRS